MGFHIPIKNEVLDIYGQDYSLAYFQQNLWYSPNFVRKKIVDLLIYEDLDGYVSYG